MKSVLSLCLLGLLALSASASVTAGICKENVQLSNSWDALSNGSWQSDCESVGRVDTSDPYNPKPALAKYYTFTLERDADIRIQLDPSYSDYYGRFNLIEGGSEYGNILSSHQSGEFETRLNAGTYTLEVSHIYGASFTYKIAFNDTALNNECVQTISTGTPISEGWIATCESTNRDMVDPYNTIPGEGHRTKYFTFSLQDHTDVRIEVDATVNSYIYILSGIGEHAVPYEEFNSETVTTSLPQGDYTIELTTFDRYAPGQFNIELNTYSNAGGCSQDMILGSIVSGSWSAGCEIRSWFDENGDPYQGEGPERANYYSFTLTEAKELRFSLSGQNDSSTIFSLYEAGDYLNKLATTQSNYWSRPSNEFSIRLEPGNYELEVTKYNEVAIGSYTISSFIFENDGCTNSIQLGVTEEAYLVSGCQSLFRVVDGGMDDPYGAQPGTYYAKRFEFTLDDPSTILMSASTYPQKGYLYLAKRVNGQWQRLTESWPENYWSTTSNSSISRTLDTGTYALEVTSYYPEREGEVTVNIRASGSSSCATYLTLNTLTTDLLGSNSNCRSEFKSSEYNYDPYGSNNGYQHYFAKSFTFEIEQAGNYNIVGSSQSFSTHLYLVQGGDVKGQLITDQVIMGENSFNQYFEPGIYTVEVTSLTASGVGSYSLLVWDGSSEIEDEAGINECIQALSSQETNFNLVGSLTVECESTSRSARYAKYFDFTIQADANADVEINLLAPRDTYLYLQRWNGNELDLIESDDDGGAGANSKIVRSLSAGSYRIEATTYSSRVLTDFQLQLSIVYADTDGDGVFDHQDAFPNDINEWLDSDGDSVGDNADAFPENASEWHDTDNDGIGNNADMDDDNDGVFDYLDALPLDNEAYMDSDFDGISDELDEYPYPYAGDIRFTVKDMHLLESENKAVITIERVGHPFLDASIFFYTEDDSAVANVDYVPINGKLEFGPYVNSHTIEVDLIDDYEYSSNRSFLVKLAFPSVFVSSSQGLVAKVTIENDDPLPVDGLIGFTVSYLSVNESDLSAQVEISRTESLSEAVISVSTKDSSAIASIDYEAISELLVFSEGETSKTISIPLIDNSIFENDKSFFVILTPLSTEALISQNSTDIVIVDNDLLPETGEISLVVNHMQVNEEQGEIDFALQRTVGATGEVQIDWSVPDNMALSGIELLTRSGFVTFKEGESYKSISLYLLKEMEQFGGLSQEMCIDLVITKGNAKLSDNEFCLTFLETDLPPESGYVTFSGASYSTYEGSPVSVTLNRLFSLNEDEDTLINIQTEMASAERGLDYFDYYADVQILGGEQAKSIMLETMDDDIFEEKENYLVTISNAGNGQTVPVYILDNDKPLSGNGVFRFSGSEYPVNEDESSISVVVQRIFGFEGEVSLQVDVEAVSAEPGSDFDDSIIELTFEDGESSKLIEIEIYPNQASYDEKTFSVSLHSNTDNLLSTPNSALVTINNVDKPDSGSKGLLGLGSLSMWWVLLFLLPISLIRIKRVEV